MSVYYNDNDRNACAWLRELIKDGLLPKGEVDERSITDVRASELKGFTQCHFFAGIGGWAYALALAGWPKERKVWTGSPPCQDNSNAGAIWGVRAGLRGKRSGLALCWLDLVSAFRPETVFFENVPGIEPWLPEITCSLEISGYTVSRQDKAAGDIGAPHKRRRVWLVADINGKRLEEPRRAKPPKALVQPWRTTPRNLWRTNNTRNGGVAHGIPGRVGTVRAFGNAIVPQVAAEFIKAYLTL